MYSCPDCKVAFRSSEALVEHERASGHNIPSSSAQPAVNSKRKSNSQGRHSPVKCRQCGDVLQSRRTLYEHRMLSHNEHVVLQTNPWVNTSDAAPWEGGRDPKLKHTYDVHASIILHPHKMGAVKSIYNFPVTNAFSMFDIKRQIEHIFASENTSFKINVSFGLILVNVETGEYRYFTPYQNTHIFPKPVLINIYGDLTKLYRKMNAINLTDYIMKQRPDTKWKPFMVTNVRYSVFKIGYPLGCGTDLPSHITASKSIMSLIRNNSTGRNYDDNLCAFRCLAFHRTHSIRRERLVKTLFHRWRQCTSDFNTPFKGVLINDLPAFEECFHVNVNVYELTDDHVALTIYVSRRRYESTMNLNVCGNHLSYITKLSSYSKKYRCRCCGRCSNTPWKAIQHERKCDGKTKLVHPGGYYAAPKSIFDRLAEWNIQVEQQQYDWFIVFDFEAALMTERQSDSIWRHSHRPISVSIASNVPTFESEKFYFSDDLDQLLTDMISHMTEVGARACQLARRRWRHAFRRLRHLIDLWRNTSDEETDGDDDDDDEESSLRPPNVFHTFLEELNHGCWAVNFNSWTDPDNNIDDDGDDDDGVDDLDTTVFSDKVRRMSLKHLTRLYRDLARYCQEVPVLGFNSANYDLNVIKSKFSKHLGIHDNTDAFTVKRANSYMCMSNGRLRFLDIMQYIPPGTTYSKFLKTFGIAEEKSFFPYEWLDDVEKLQQTALPPQDAFWSSLKGANTLESEDRVRYEMLLKDGKPMDQALSHMKLTSPPDSTVDSNYMALQSVWKERKMKTMLDFLAYYNNLDVGPFRDAATKFQALFFEKGVDIFKSCISAPGAARIMLFRHGFVNGASFSLCGKSDADLYRTIKANLVGGPSVIFHRYHKAGETRLRGAAGKTCRSIIGFDANALYLHAIGKHMPVGNFVRRSKTDGFYPHVRDQHQLMFDWMDYLNHSQQVTIQHKMNHRTEKRVGGYYVDGFDPVSGVHYEFHGCYYHGHRCALTDRIRNDKWKNELRDKFWKRTEEKREFLDAMGLEVLVMWECEFRQQIATDDGVRDFVNARRHSFHRHHHGRVNASQILKAVRDEEMFGMVEVDIQVPNRWGEVVPDGTTLNPAAYFGEMSPLFCNSDVPFDLIGDHMQQHVKRHELCEKPRRLLIGGMSAKRLLLATPLLKWYLDHGLVVTDVHQVIEFRKQRCFHSFEREVTVARRMGDADPDKVMLAGLMKLVGNSSYGSMILDKSKHTDVKYAKGQSAACRLVNDRKFIDLCELEDDVFEVEMAKGKISLDLPTQLGYYVLQYAKLRMLEYYYDFLIQYVDRADFQYMEMDTDSAYFALSSQLFEDVIKPCMISSYRLGLTSFCRAGDFEADNDNRWFPRTCCRDHERDDLRTPGLFKVEFLGTEMVGLCSKTYCIVSSITHHSKYSAKGVNKKAEAPMETFRRVLENEKSAYVVNKGLRAHKNTVFTYEQRKCAFTYFYCKRMVLEDGVSTVPLDLTLEPSLPSSSPYGSPNTVESDIL